jgi:eukaryotic-like serine/threonine-protein kinase
MNLEPGAIVGAYRITEMYRQGGMATVYKARHVRLDRQVALKVVKGALSDDETFLERFRVEAKIVAQLRHPSIVEVFHAGVQDGMPYLATEFVDSGSLAERMGAPMSAAEVAQLLRPIAAALDYAHGQGILHRDIKPSNILLTNSGAPILADFGIAKLVASDIALTRTGQVMGTPAYMAPEQVMGEPPVGPGTDQYALAIVAYELLTGHVPFEGETPVSVLMAHVHRALPPARVYNPDLNGATEEVLVRGLAKRPQDRYPSVSAFTLALEAAAQRGATSTPTSEAPPTETGGQNAGPKPLGWIQALLQKLGRRGKLRRAE